MNSVREKRKDVIRKMNKFEKRRQVMFVNQKSKSPKENMFR